MQWLATACDGANPVGAPVEGQTLQSQGCDICFVPHFRPLPLGRGTASETVSKNET